MLDQEKIDQYMKAISVAGSDKETSEKLAAMWLYAAQFGNPGVPPSSVRKIESSGRPIMLIPAKAGNSTLLHPPMPPRPLPTNLMLPPPGIPPYHGNPIPLIHPAASYTTLMYPGSIPGSMPGTFRTHKSAKSGISTNKRRRTGPNQPPRSGKMEANRRQRRKSEADIIEGHSFEYHGLDRAIADSFLARQELSNAGSHVDYSSSSTASDTIYGQRNTSRASKTKIICRDVEM